MLDILPLELLQLILADRSIGLGEIGAVTSVCSRLRPCADSSEFWRNKFAQRWPSLEETMGHTTDHWREWYKRRVECKRAIRGMVADVSLRYHKKEELPKEAFVSVKCLTEKHLHGFTFVIDELRSILYDSCMYDNLTMKYYAEKILCFVRQDQLQRQWETYLRLPPAEQSIERGATGAILVALWFQPTGDTDESSVVVSLDEIASLAAMNLAERHCDHPAALRQRVSPHESLPESLWTPQVCVQVLRVINWTLFEQLGFCEDSGAYYLHENSFLNKVLERKVGIPITLCILYLVLARRFGVVCELVGFPSKCILRFKEHPLYGRGHQFTFIDVCNKGNFCNAEEVRNMFGLLLGNEVDEDFVHRDAMSTVMVLERMIRNVMEAGRRLGNMSNGIWFLRSGLELMLILRPEDIEGRLLLSRIYLHLNINLAEVLSNLQEVLARDPSQTGIVAYMYRTCQTRLSNPEEGEHSYAATIDPLLQTRTTVKRRPIAGNVLYAIGMIMVHRQYNYTCVIHGWDAQCVASREWILQMGVHRLPKREFQPFYNVLADDGSIRYAAQDNLKLSLDPKFIEHPDVGRYFATFTGTHFEPNEQMCCEYPDDESVRKELLRHAFVTSVPVG